MGISDGRRRGLLDLGDRRMREKYLAHVRQLQEATERMAAAHRMPLVGIHTTDDTMDALQRLYDGLRGVPGTGREAA